MFTFIVLFIISLIPFLKEGKFSLLHVLLLMQAFVLVLFLIEYSNGTIEYLISDGKRYFEEATNYLDDNDRKAWGFFNFFIKEYDYFPETFIKFMNIPILFIFIFYLQKTFPILNYKFLIVFPYLFFLSISNLRDILIWLSALLIIRFYFIKKSPIFFVLSSILLIFLRPTMLVPIVLFIGINFFYKNFVSKKSTLSTSSKFRGVILFLIITGSVIVFSGNLTKRVKQISYSLNYRYVENLDNRLDQRAKGSISARSLDKAFLLGSIRYVITPLPTSKLKMLLSDKPEIRYGYFTEYFRVYSQIIYFFMMFYLILNVKYLFRVFKKISSGQMAYLFWLFSFFPIYSFYHFGTGHQRLKLPFQIFIFIIFLYTYYYKRNRRIYV